MLDDELLDDKDSPTAESESLSTSESQLEVKFAGIIEEFYGKLKEDPKFTCCSCERLLLKKKTLTHFTVEKFKSSVWIQLKNYLLAMWLQKYCTFVLIAGLF